MNNKKIILKYIFFAIFATFANLLTQRIILSFFQTNFFFLVAILLGTFVGLIIKFYLDKTFIFFDRTKDLKNIGQKFSLYSTNGIFSTIIFWGTESIFWIIWQKDNMREIGAILGLSIGYIMKFKLDKKYVFEN